jgi:hypothetical protein
MLMIKHQNHLDKWAGVHFPYTDLSGFLRVLLVWVHVIST